jgi:ribosomal protein S18 acetylase RimI-like enzyme
MDDVTIRCGRPADIGAVLALWAGARSPHASTPDDAAAVALVLEQDALVVAARGDRIVGTLIAGWDGWRGSMARLAVAPDMRRRGLATRLVAEGERRLRERGARRVNALVDASDEGVRAMWESLGYGADGATARFVRDL